MALVRSHPVFISIYLPFPVLEPKKGLQPMLGQGEVPECGTLFHSTGDEEVPAVEGDHTVQELAGIRRQRGEACEGDTFICSLRKEDFT